MNRKLPLAWLVVVFAICGVWFVAPWFTGASSKQVSAGKEGLDGVTRTLPARGQASAGLSGSPERDDADGQTNTIAGYAIPSPDATVAAPKATPRTLVGNKPVRASTGGSGWGLTRAPPSKAVMRIDGGEIAPQNFSGHYQRVLLGKMGKADIRVEFPEDGASRQVLVRAIQGGKINGADNYAVFDLGGDKKEIAFTFESGRESGLSEIILRRGTTEEVLQFWAPTASPQYDPPALRVSVR